MPNGFTIIVTPQQRIGAGGSRQQDNKQPKNNMMETKQTKIMRRFKTFDLHAEIWDVNGNVTPIEVYRNKLGNYISVRYRGKRCGLVRAIAKLEITPEPSSRRYRMCSVGKSAKDGKWYGWSHCAMVGFGPGDHIFQEHYTGDGKTCASCKKMGPCEGLLCPNSISFIHHGEHPILNDADARKAAVAFSRHVS